jgi:AAHS family 4-hydroxybenzoate transporter-like MFS transporter
MLSIYIAFSWLPTMLTAAGLDVAVAGSGLTAYNIGGLIGILACAAAISRFGSRWPLVLCCAGAAVSAFLLSRLEVVAHTRLFIFGLGINGLFVNAVVANLYAVCAYVYPTNVRATGTASALAFGRLGAILSAFVGAEMIGSGGADRLLGLLATAMAGAMIALGMLRRHIPTAVWTQTLTSDNSREKEQRA